MSAPTEGFTLAPFWLGYAVALAVCVGWAWRLSREAAKRDAETTERQSQRNAETWALYRKEWEDAGRAAPPTPAPWRAIQRERGE